MKQMTAYLRPNGLVGNLTTRQWLEAEAKRISNDGGRKAFINVRKDNRVCLMVNEVELIKTEDAYLKNVWNKNKTKCNKGHAFTPDNLVPNKAGKRQCRKCHYAASKKYLNKKLRSCGREQE